MVGKLVKINIGKLLPLLYRDILTDLEPFLFPGDSSHILHGIAIVLWHEYLVILTESVWHAEQFLIHLHAGLRHEEVLVNEFLADLLNK